MNTINKKEILIIFIIPLIITIILSYYCVRISAWGPDQTASYLQTINMVKNGEFQRCGIYNSIGFKNPNGLVLFSAPFIFLTQNPFILSMLLFIFQSFIILLCLKILLSLFKISPSYIIIWFFLPLLLWTPAICFTSIELWAQYISRTLFTFLCVIASTSMFYENKYRDFTLGFLILFLPSIHLGLVVIVPFSFIFVSIYIYKEKICFFPFFLGIIFAFLISWFFWFNENISLIILFISKILKKGNVKVDFYKCIPTSELIKLLLHIEEGHFLQVLSKATSESTNALLKYLSIFRFLIISIVVTFSLIFRKIINKIFFKYFYVSFSLILIFFLVLGILGRAPFSDRPDIGLVFIQIFILLISIMGMFLLNKYLEHDSKIIKKVLICLLTFLHFLVLLFAIYKVSSDTLKRPIFYYNDIPLFEKMECIKSIKNDSSNLNSKIKITYVNNLYLKVYDFIPQLQKREPLLYYSEAFLNYQLNNTIQNKLKDNKYIFVPLKEIPDLIIIHPIPKDEVLRLKFKKIEKHYKLLKKWNYLALYQNVK